MFKKILFLLSKSGEVVCAVTKTSEKWWDYLIPESLSNRYWVYNCSFVIKDIKRIVFKKSGVYIYLKKE